MRCRRPWSWIALLPFGLSDVVCVIAPGTRDSRYQAAAHHAPLYDLRRRYGQRPRRAIAACRRQLAGSSAMGEEDRAARALTGLVTFSLLCCAFPMARSLLATRHNLPSVNQDPGADCSELSSMTTLAVAVPSPVPRLLTPSYRIT